MTRHPRPVDVRALDDGRWIATRAGRIAGGPFVREDDVLAIAAMIEAGELVADKSMSDREFLAPLVDIEPS